MPQVIEREVESLRPDHRLTTRGPFEVFLGPAQRMPHCLREIGRLREETFRAVGEGTGRSLDLDIYDHHHQHLFTWHAECREIVGASRLAATEPTLAQFGVGGLYINSLFELDAELFRQIGPALELGRSFVRTEYQRHNSALLALWKGIASMLARGGERKLFGAASISQEFHPTSRDLMVAFLARSSDARLASRLRAKNPYRGAPVEPPATLGELCERVLSIESGARSVPFLVRQSFKLGARALGFNVDPDFSNVVDALMLLDLDGPGMPMLSRLLRNQGQTG